MSPEAHHRRAGASSPESDEARWDDKAPLLPQVEVEQDILPARRSLLRSRKIAILAGAAFAAVTFVETDSSLPQLAREHLVGDTDRWLISNRKWDSDAAPTTRYHDWVISEALAPPGGIHKYMVLVNGKSPGPIVEANLGDKIVINVHNKLRHDSTSIHWHGMWQRGTNFMDGTMSINGCGIPPGKNATYIWYAQTMGTAWYHSHRAMQYTDGLFGPIIIHSPNEPAHRLNKYDDELTLMVGDLYNTRTRDLPTKTTGRRPADSVPDGALINGFWQAKCAYLYPSDEHPGTNWCGKESTEHFESTLVGGNTYRIRLVNTGSLVPFTFSIDNHDFHVIEADGTSLAPYKARMLSMDVGHRYSILVKLDQKPAAYWMTARLETHEMVFKGPKLNTTTFGVLRYKGAKGKPADIPGPDVPDGEADAGPATNFPPAVPLQAPLSTAHHTILYGVRVMPNGASSMVFNDNMWRPLPDGTTLRSSARVIGSQYNVLVTEPTVVDLIVNARDNIATHPFHLHGHSFWIMSQGPRHFQGDSRKLDRTNPMRRDTFVIPPGEHAVIRFIADNPGIWPLHCHVAWHLEGGLLMTVTSMPHDMIKMDIRPT